MDLCFFQGLEKRVPKVGKPTGLGCFSQCRMEKVALPRQGDVGLRGFDVDRARFAFLRFNFWDGYREDSFFE